MELHAVDCRVQVADHPSEIFPVAFVWIYHTRREERNCWLYVWPCALAEEEDLGHQAVEDYLVSIAQFLHALSTLKRWFPAGFFIDFIISSGNLSIASAM